MLHGRTGFFFDPTAAGGPVENEKGNAAPVRNYKGAYTDWDEVISKINVLKTKRIQS